MPENGYLLYKLNISVITPLHIGNGVDLLNEYDYAIQQGKTWRINEAALLDIQDVDDPALADILARTPPAHLLKPGDYQEDSPLFRYVIKGTPRSRAEGAQVQEQLKDTFDHPYLPGSSVKGALRTALAWHAWGKLKLEPDASKLKRQRQWAGQEYEAAMFGADPNHDLLRALQVGDSQPVDADRLLILNVRVLNQRGVLGSPIEMEAIHADTSFQSALKIDTVLFSNWARQHGFNLRGGDWLLNIASAGKAHAQQRITDEMNWYAEFPAGQKLHTFYRRLAEYLPDLGPNQFFMQLGWGTGWPDKTYGSRLQEDEHFMERILQDYRLSRGRRDVGDPFPKSRRVVVSITRAQNDRIAETPVSPLGWALIEMEAAG